MRRMMWVSGLLLFISLTGWVSANPEFQTVVRHTTLRFPDMNGMALNPHTGHLFLSSSTKGALAIIDPIRGIQVTETIPWPDNAILKSTSMPNFSITVDEESGAIYGWGNSNATTVNGASTTINKGVIYRWENEGAPPQIAAPLSNGFSRTMKVYGQGTVKFIYMTGSYDKGPIHIMRSTDAGKTFIPFDIIPGPAGKSGVSIDSRTLNTASGATIVWGHEHALSGGNPVAIRLIKTNPGFTNPTDTANRTDWQVDNSSLYWQTSGVDTSIPGFSPDISAIRIVDSVFDARWNCLVLAGRNQSSYLYLAHPVTGKIYGAYPLTRSNGLRTQVEIQYVTASTHRAFITNRGPEDYSPWVYLDVIDYGPPTFPVAQPSEILLKPGSSPIYIRVSDGVPPYNWSLSGIGDLKYDTNDVVLFTPGNKAGTGKLILMDSAMQKLIIPITITPNIAPMLTNRN